MRPSATTAAKFTALEHFAPAAPVRGRALAESSTCVPLTASLTCAMKAQAACVADAGCAYAGTSCGPNAVGRYQKDSRFRGSRKKRYITYKQLCFGIHDDGEKPWCTCSEGPYSEATSASLVAGLATPETVTAMLVPTMTCMMAGAG